MQFATLPLFTGLPRILDILFVLKAATFLSILAFAAIAKFFASLHNHPE
jgi:hypothetical protein